MKSAARPLLGLGLLFLFAAGMLAGIRYGNAVVWRLNLDPNREPLPILMYHNIVPSDGGYDLTNDMLITPEKLREDFDYLEERGYTTVLPRELLDPESLPDKPILITFDDGYENTYNLLYPLLQEYGFKVVISPIVRATDWYAETFCNWYAFREMVASGLVEIGSHTYDLHNADHNGMYQKGEPNGIQRKRFETIEEFQTRVLDDIQKSYDRITEEIGVEPVFFAYPFGAIEPDAQSLIDELFPVSVTTIAGTADMARGLHRMPRWTVSMDTNLMTMVG